MDGLPRAPKKDWIVTPAAFDKLLAALDPDRERAGEHYERIRQKLTKLFHWRGCALPEEYVDRTIDRVARRLDEGAELRVPDPYLYFHGVALNVLREFWREQDRVADGEPRAAVDDPFELADRSAAQASRERRLECLDRCLGGIPERDKDLLATYHLESGPAKERRAHLAEALRIPMNALRIRAYRVRQALEGCVHGCLERSRAG